MSSACFGRHNLVEEQDYQQVLMLLRNMNVCTVDMDG